MRQVMTALPVTSAVRRESITVNEMEHPMRYLMMQKQTDSAPDERLFAEMGAFIEELTASGVLLATGGLAPSGITLKSKGDEVTVTDGPFAEAKEAIGGFALIEVGTEEEAIELGRRFRRIVGDGESTMQQVYS